MGRTKIVRKIATTETPEKNTETQVSAIRKDKSALIAGIRILCQGTSPKLTPRGHGNLSYELGVDDATHAAYIRISGNESSGAYSHEWLELITIQSILAINAEGDKSLSAVCMDSLFSRRSANNCGYLAAILVTEGVLKILPGKPIMLGQGSWEQLWKKIKKLEETEISLTDHIAIAAKQKAKKKAQAAANLPAAKGKKQPPPPDNADEKAEVEDDEENIEDEEKVALSE